MSSLVRKSSHFTPKVKKRPIRKASVGATPPATQATDTETRPVEPSVEALAPESAPSGKLASPPATQKDSETLEIPHVQGAEDIDPTQKTEPAVEEHSDHEDYGDNDIFKQPFFKEEQKRRRSSVASHRRLSGLGGFRQGSVSGTPGPAETESEAAPVNIAIPVTKPSKKRRHSSISKASKVHRPSIIAPPEDLLQEEQNEDDGATAVKPQVKVSKPAIHFLSTADVTIGICPKTNKLRKFRTSENVVGYDELPVAPADLITTVTDIKQIPKYIDLGDEELFSQVHVLADDLSLAELCKPTIKIGTTTSNFKKARQALVKIAARRDERRSARIMAREKKIPYEKALQMIQGDLSAEDIKKPDFTEEPTESNEPGTGIQMTIVGGKLQLDQDSTVLSRNPAANSHNREVEIENSFENPITSSSYTKVTHTDAWTQDEVIQLYKALSTWGTNFTFISQLFPYRTRRQVKRKFAAEEKKNPQLVELALKRKLPLDIEDYKQALPTGERLKTIDDYKKEMEKVQKEHQKIIEEIQIGRERAMLEDKQKKENMSRGPGGLTKREINRNLRRNEVVLGSVDDFKHIRNIEA